MTSVNPLSSLNVSTFVNSEIREVNATNRPQQAVEQATHEKSKSEFKDQQVIKAEYVKVADDAVLEQVDEIFTRSNRYAKMSTSSQLGIQAYQDIAVSSQKESIRNMLGVDLYA